MLAVALIANCFGSIARHARLSSRNEMIAFGAHSAVVFHWRVDAVGRIAHMHAVSIVRDACTTFV